MHLFCSSAEIVIYDDGDDENKKIDNKGYDDGTQIYVGSHDLSEYSSCGKQTSYMYSALLRVWTRRKVFFLDSQRGRTINNPFFTFFTNF